MGPVEADVWCFEDECHWWGSFDAFMFFKSPILISCSRPQPAASLSVSLRRWLFQSSRADVSYYAFFHSSRDDDSSRP